MPAWDLPAGHVGVNFDVGVGVNFGVGVVGVAGGRGGGGGDAFFIVRALVARSFNSSEIFAQRIERRPSRPSALEAPETADLNGWRGVIHPGGSIFFYK